MADPTSIPGLNGISGDLPRRGGGHLPPRRTAQVAERKPAEESAISPATSAAIPEEPTSALVQALDRLRATQELRPVDSELVRALRGAKHYQDESRHDLPLLDDPAASDHGGLPPDQVG